MSAGEEAPRSSSIPCIVFSFAKLRPPDLANVLDRTLIALEVDLRWEGCLSTSMKPHSIIMACPFTQ
ncbi:MAG: hypothetical protein AAGA39_10820 [Pseudomonadota bacterium]